MLTVLGILLLVAGAILTFAVDRQADGVDLQAMGWILMAGGGLSLLAEMIRVAGVSSVRPDASSRSHVRSQVEEHHVDEHVDGGALRIEDRRAA